eukprot:TRINITY_DN4585_c0_g3_i1.p1 TRINITY_DN4585_c0_g3~~TRINITY_DN4585_c0_g3_i1.p1  ORF type:complete len:193 (-),score=48.75 TRINITY_DN4585_c0_g3_i1:4-582(-)
MFITIKLEDKIEINANDLDNQKEAIEKSINKKYLDKVIKNTGLVISLKQILKVMNAKLMYGSGLAYFNVIFILVIFRPLKGELLTGKVKENTPNGVKVSLGFFEDVFVPSYLLNKNSTYSESQNLWWTDLESGPGDYKYWYVLDAEILVRVSNIIFNKSKNEGKIPEESEPMVVMASTQEHGLGIIKWWEDL